MRCFSQEDHVKSLGRLSDSVSANSDQWFQLNVFFFFFFFSRSQLDFSVAPFLGEISVCGTLPHPPPPQHTPFFPLSNWRGSHIPSSWIVHAVCVFVAGFHLSKARTQVPKAVLNWVPNTCLWAALSVGNIQARGFVLNWCFCSWRAAVFKAHEHALRCSKCFQRKIWEQASDWLNSFVMEEKKQKRVQTLDQLGFASNGLRPFLIEPEHILPNKHHKQPLILKWRSLCACRVRQCSVSVCRFQPNRGIGREAVHGKTAVHRSRARREEQARGEEQDTDFGCMCAGTHRKYRRKVQKTQRDLFGNLDWKLSVHTHTNTHTHTHTHNFITHDRF